MKTKYFKFLFAGILLVYSLSGCYERRQHKERVEESREHQDRDGDHH